MHFPASLLVNAGLDYWHWNGALSGFVGVLIGWTGAMLLAAVFQRATNGWQYSSISTYGLASKHTTQSKI
jgi:ABC-type lipoprotein release transport system permease subunit